MADRPKNITSTTSRITFKYPKLTEPDTKFKEEGEYSVLGILPADSPEAERLIQLIDREAQKSLEEAQSKAKTPAERKKWETKYKPYSEEEDKETGEPTGNIVFKFTAKASGVSKKTGKAWTRKIDLFDAKGRPLPKDVKIGGGTVGKISFEVIPYAPTPQVGASVKLGLNAVQVIDLKSYGSRDAKGYGFGEEDGYDASEDGDVSEDTSATETSSDEIDDDIPF